MKPSGSIRNHPADFVVDEIPMYAAAGSGDHVFAVVRKTDWSTLSCMRRIAKQLGIDASAMGHAGMKDRHAMTTQTLSFPWQQGDPLPCLRALNDEGIEVVSLQRHPHKLRVGHLIGNRFRIVVRDIRAEDRAAIEAELDRIGTEGVPNVFGPQRFGKDGNNPERALCWLRGEHRGPRDARTQKLLLSSIQSMLFDKLLARRVANGTWNTVLEGDLVKTADRGGLFMTEDADADARRAAHGEVTATGPIFGPRMRWPGGEPEAWERAVLDEFVGSPKVLADKRKLGAGSRRALRIVPRNFKHEFSKQPTQPALTVQMTLPKGAYATTVLGAVFQLRDASARPRAASDKD